MIHFSGFQLWANTTATGFGGSGSAGLLYPKPVPDGYQGRVARDQTRMGWCRNKIMIKDNVYSLYCFWVLPAWPDMTQACHLKLEANIPDTGNIPSLP